MAELPSRNPAEYRPLGVLRGRRYEHVASGKTISRRDYMKLQRAAGRAPAPTESTRDKVTRALHRVVNLGESKTQAARREGLSPEAASHDPRWEQLSYNPKTRRGELHAAGTTSFFDADGMLHQGVPFDSRNLRTLSAYGGALKSALKGRPSGLASFAGVTVMDVFGNIYTLQTDVNRYQQLMAAYDIGDPMDYFKSGDEVVTPAGGGGASGGRAAA